MLTRCQADIVPKTSRWIRILRFELADHAAHIDRLLRGLRLERGDALLEFDQPFLALDDDVHTGERTGGGVSVEGIVLCPFDGVFPPVP